MANWFSKISYSIFRYSMLVRKMFIFKQWKSRPDEAQPRTLVTFQALPSPAAIQRSGLA